MNKNISYSIIYMTYNEFWSLGEQTINFKNRCEARKRYGELKQNPSTEGLIIDGLKFRTIIEEY